MIQAYYGVTLLIGSMSGDLYLNQLLGFLVEAPAIAATTLAIGRLGRRSTAAFLLLQGKRCCALLSTHPPFLVISVCLTRKPVVANNKVNLYC